MLVVVVAVVVGAVVALRRHKRAAQVGCGTAIADALYSVDPEQASNAATIAAAGVRLGMPNHAVTIALATALLESRLRNLTSGDRDSVGLFQQRPSQGWGSRAQLLDPRYAANAFYRALVKVPGWQTIDVTVAAQAVQRSAMPTGYAGWESEARALARALTGEVPAGFVCQLGRATPPTGLRSAVTAALLADFGSVSLASPLPSTRGWALASWLVAKATDLDIRSVRFDGSEWVRDRGSWLPVGPADARLSYAF